MQDQLAWALGCALLWALGSSLWIIGLALLALYAILHALEKSRRFHPVTIPSSLWSDLDKLTLEDLDQAVRSRRRDDGFEVHALNSARVLWSGGAKAKKTKTKLCVVYIHGWSASPQENQAVVEPLAAALGANLLMVRLSGHGAVSQMEGNPKTGELPNGGIAGSQLLEWTSPEILLNDAFDAARIGLRLGDRLVLVGSSTGGALCSYIAAKASPELKSKVACLVGISAAFRVGIPAYPAVSTLFAWLRVFGGDPGHRASSRLVGLLAGGPMRNLQPMKDAHVISSTLRYPTPALLACFGAIWEAGHIPFEDLNCPVLLIGSERDQTINWRHTATQVYPRLSGPKLLYTVMPNLKDHQHVLGSHIQSSGYVAEISAAVNAFVVHHSTLQT